MSIVSRAAAATGRAIVAVANAVSAEVGFREILLFAGAGLIGYGLFLVWLPGAFIVPGVLVAYVAVFGVK